MNHETYWMVHCPTHGAPNVRHLSLVEARAEAERLARAHPGRRFYVKNDVQWDGPQADDDGMPF
jgi:hypothetical protein